MFKKFLFFLFIGLMFTNVAYARLNKYPDIIPPNDIPSWTVGNRQFVKTSDYDILLHYYHRVFKIFNEYPEDNLEIMFASTNFNSSIRCDIEYNGIEYFNVSMVDKKYYISAYNRFSAAFNKLSEENKLSFFQNNKYDLNKIKLEHEKEQKYYNNLSILFAVIVFIVLPIGGIYLLVVVVKYLFKK